MLSSALAVGRPGSGRGEASVSELHFRCAIDVPGGVPRGAALAHVDEPAAASRERVTPTQPSSGRSGYRVGDVIARKYRLRAMIGEGGMGTVWAARNEDLELDVAIKLVHRHLDVEEITRRLLTEARAEARIEHPGVVRVLDVGAPGRGDSFLVMELLHGRSLGKLIEETGRLTPEVAVKILLPVIDALAHAHDRGVVHCDLKPENIFLADSGGRTQPKVVDFGIAKLSEHGPGARPTRRGAIAGTPEYMAPEQASGGDVDSRADVWALSLVLYEAVTGRLPFEATSSDATPEAVMERRLMPTTELGVGDDELWQILERGLQMDMLCRHSSMRAMGRGLADWLLGRGETTDITGASVSDTWLQPSSETQPAASRTVTFIVPRRRRAHRWAVGLAVAASLTVRAAPVARISERIGAAAATEIVSTTIAPTPEHREPVPAVSTEKDAVIRAPAPLPSPRRKSRPIERAPYTQELKNPYQ